MHYTILFICFLMVASCSDNTFSSIDTTTPSRVYSTDATLSTEDPDEAILPFLGVWNGALSSVEPDAPQKIKIMDSALDNAVLLEFGNGVIHRAQVMGDYAILPLTGTSWKNAVEECPPTADLFVTIKIKLMDNEETLDIENHLKNSTRKHSDLFQLVSR